MSRKTNKAQLSFTAGELDPKIKDRDDVKYYFTGAEKMRNVLCIPQGGFRRRPGLKYLDFIRPPVTLITSGITATAAQGGTANNAWDNNTSTELTTTNPIGTVGTYQFIHYDLGSAKKIVFADLVGARLSAGSDSGFYVQYSTDNVSWTQFGAVANTMPLTTTDVTRRFSNNNPRSVTARYWRALRSGGADLGAATITIDEFSLWEDTGDQTSYCRLVPFQFSTTQKYLLVFTRNNIAVYKDGVWQCDVRNYPISDTELATFNWTQSLDTLIGVHEDKEPIRLQRGSDHNQWDLYESLTYVRKPTAQFDNITTTGNLTPAATSGTGITLTSTVNEFVAGHVGKYVRGNGGFALITAQGGTTATVTVIEPYRFTNTDPIGPGDWTIEENVWSSTRGYPRTVTFHGGRLWFGGSRDKPSTLWGSKSGSFFDFGYGTGLDDEAIDITLDTDQVNAIRQIYSGRNLAIFTDEAEFYVPRPTNDPTTPANASVLRTSSHGIKEGVRVVEVTGAIIFVQKSGKTIREFLWNEGEQGYKANPLSLLSAHLIRDPVDLFVRKSTSTEDADFVLMPNGDDGTLTVLTTLRDQEVNAFSLIQTNGSFKAAAAIDSDMYFAVERDINGTTYQFLEVFDDDYMLDCSIKQAGTATQAVTGLSHLEGESVLIIGADHEQKAAATVTSGTATTTGTAWTGTAEAGLAWPDVKGDGNSDNVWVKTMPFSIQLPEGHQKGKLRRVIEVFARLFESREIYIQGKPVTIASAPLTGDVKKQGLLGWDEYGQVDITQRTHTDLTVLSVTNKVAI